MCERLASSANPSPASVTIANLSYTHERQELVRVIEDLENIPKKMLASSLEILHDVNVRNSISLKLHRTKKIDEIRLTHALSEFANIADVTRFEQGILLAKSCIAWEAQPDKLYELMTALLKKKITPEAAPSLPSISQ